MATKEKTDFAIRVYNSEWIKNRKSAVDRTEKARIANTNKYIVRFESTYGTIAYAICRFWEIGECVQALYASVIEPAKEITIR